MNTHERFYNSADTDTDTGWDDLKTVSFAGENSQNKNKTFNEKYINDFGRDKLRDILNNKETLSSMSADYLNQYEPNSKARAVYLAGKESLDHYVLERLSGSNPEAFINSQEFKNYSEFIANIADNKKYESKDKKECLYPEYFTNPVLKNKNLRELVLKTAYPNVNTNKLNTWLDREETHYSNTINYFIQEGIDKRRNLSQTQINILGDYIYAGKNFQDGVAEKYANYCFNEIKESSNIKPSTEMLGALSNYFASQYTIDDDVKKSSRFIIANPESKKDQNSNVVKDFKIGVSRGFGCVLEQNHFLDMSLTSDNSLNKSRTNKENDLYRFMMISFHELTHDHQKNLVKNGDKSGSAMMYIMRDILNRGSGCYVGKSADGTERKGTYYNANHDNDEIEIEADEESWRQCRNFLTKHEKMYAWNQHDESIEGKYEKHRSDCKRNEEEVRARRTFTKKLANTGEEFSAIKYDIETLESTVRKSPDILKKYPQLTDYIDASGQLKPSFFANTKLAGRQNEGFDSRDDVFGTEIGTYILTNSTEARKLIQYATSSNFTHEQAKNMVSNLFNVVHQTVEKNRALKDINFANYDETHARGKDFDLTEKKTDILKQYLVQCYNAIGVTTALKASHQQMGDELSKQEHIYIGSYYNQLSRDTNLDLSFVNKVIASYERTQNPTLLMIANQMKNDYNL